MVRELTREQARRIVVRAQLLDADRAGGVVEVARQLGGVKIDPTAVIAPAEHTILWSRLGSGYEPGQLQRAFEGDRQLFEFDGHYLPMDMLPLLRPGMRSWPRRDATRQWLDANARFRSDVLARLRADGPLAATDIPDTAAVVRESSGGWFGPGQVPHMLTALLQQGEAAVVSRRGRRRLWDIAERVYPHDLPDYADADADRMLKERRLQAAGLTRQNGPWARVGTVGQGVRVEGSAWRWRADPQALAALDDDRGGRAAILNPYDPVLFDRPRLVELFDFRYVLEQFKPKDQRRYGAFAHPILIGDRFVGLLDAAVDRDRGELRVTAVHQQVPFEPEDDDMVRAELDDLAAWLGVGLAGAD